MPRLAVADCWQPALPAPRLQGFQPALPCRTPTWTPVQQPNRAASTTAGRCGSARRRPAAAAAAPTGDLEVDVCILGAGILGLCTALVLLREDEHLKVALVDREVPCSGATGAGVLLGLACSHCARCAPANPALLLQAARIHCLLCTNPPPVRLRRSRVPVALPP